MKTGASAPALSLYATSRAWPAPAVPHPDITHVLTPNLPLHLTCGDLTPLTFRTTMPGHVAEFTFLLSGVGAVAKGQFRFLFCRMYTKARSVSVHS